jgi:glucose-1-phosphate thymidylyltransferase
MKGIVLAGGTGSRLFPITLSVSKQLLPIYDKPMVYYPISTLMQAGIREIALITREEDQKIYQSLLGNGESIGVEFEYFTQPKPEGLAQAFLIAESFIQNDRVALILGDNLFHGQEIAEGISSSETSKAATIFAYPVQDPQRYGVIEIDENGIPSKIEEKPTNPKSNLAIPGIYFFDNRVVGFAKSLSPSARGELEITALIEKYLELGELQVKLLRQGTAWLDTGTFESLHDASTYVRVLQERQGLKIADLEGIARSKGWIN